MHGRLLRDGRIEVVAQRCGERHLVARLHLDRIEDRRQAAVADGREQLGERLDLGLELAGSETGLDCRVALRLGLGGGRLHRFLGGERLGLDAGDLGHQLLAELGCGLELGGVRGAADDLARLRLERDELALELGDAIAALARLRLQALPARARLGCRRGQLAQAGLGDPERGLGLIVRGERLLLEVGRQARRVGERGYFGLEALQRLLGLGDQRLLARHVATSCSTRASSSLCRSAVRCASRSRLSCSISEAGEDGALGRLLVAQRLQLRGRVGFCAERLGLGLGGVADLLQRCGEIGLLAVDLGLRLRPAQMQHDGVELADLAGDLLVAPRLPGLALQALDLRVELAQDVVEAGQVALGGLAGAARPRAGGCAGRRCRRRPPGCGGAARAWR